MRFAVAASCLFATLAVASPITVEEAKAAADGLTKPGLLDSSSSSTTSSIFGRAPGDVQCNRTCPRARKAYLDNCEQAAKKLGSKTFEVASNSPEYVAHGNCRIRITGPENTVCRNTGNNIYSHFREIRKLGCRCGHFKWKKDEQCATVVEKTDY